MTSLKDLLKKVKKVKESKNYTTTLLECCKIIGYYRHPLKLKFPELYSNLKKIENNCLNHHIPPQQKLNEWGRKITEYIEFIQDNQELFSTKLEI